MNLHAVQEGVGIAIESLRANKVRASLTILGIVIGVATVMTMAAMIVGIRSSIMGELDALGPNNFIVERWDPTQVAFVNDGSQPEPWEGKPRITPDEADLINSLASVRSVTPSVGTNGELRHGSQSIEVIGIQGYGPLWPDYTRGDFIYGRNFLPAEDNSAARVAILSSSAAESMFGSIDPSGREIRLRGEPFQVIGVFKQADNLFTGAQQPYAVVPATTAVYRLNANTYNYNLLVVPDPSYPQSVVMDQVTATLRASRGLRPGEDNNFALVRQEALAEMFDQFTGVFFLVMLVLSSIGLMVGGVGVVGIMMISVTERTREIGVRKALGATRREILWQFLVEAVTVTLIGGMIGMFLGGMAALLIGTFSPIPAAIPLWAIGAAIGVSAITGIGFGLYPANRASRLDPVEALRYE